MRKTRIALSQAEIGQKVVEAVKNASGATLCQAGTELTERLVDRLRNAGVGFVVVEREDAGDDATRAERAAMQKARFEKVADPILLRLKPIIERALKNPNPV